MNAYDLKADFFEVTGKGAWQLRQYLCRKPAGPGRVLPIWPRQVHEHNPLDVASFQVTEDLLWRKMSNFAHQQIQRFLQQRLQVFGPAKVRTVADAPPAAFEQKTIGRKVASIFLLKLRPRCVQVRRAKWGHAHAVHSHRLFVLERKKSQTEGQDLVEQKKRVQHLPHGFDRVHWEKNRQILSPACQPESLHQHEKPAGMVGMKMRDENAVNDIRTQPGGFATAVNRLAAINEEPSLA